MMKHNNQLKGTEREGPLKNTVRGSFLATLK